MSKAVTACIKTKEPEAGTICVENVSGSSAGKCRASLLSGLLRICLDVDKNAVQRMESGQRFITDIELKAIAHALGVGYDALLED